MLPYRNGFAAFVFLFGMHVLIPFDVAPVSERAARYAVSAFGGRDDLRITAVHLTEGERSISEETVADTIESLGEEENIETSAEVIHMEGAASKEKVRDAVYRIARETDVDTVVMGYEQKSVFDDVFGESTAERILENLDTPVVLVP
jgi:nucleotide-binding universal stress UspA family protein